MADNTCNVLPTNQLGLGKGACQRERLLRICSQTSDPSCCSRIDYKLVSAGQLSKELAGEANFGQVEVSYSHNALISAIEVLIEIKNSPMFRDLTLVPSFLLPK